MRSIHIIASATLFAAFSAVAAAQTDVTGTIQLVSDVSGVYTYDMSLTDTGTTDIGTFWYAWVPGEDFLPATPTDILSPLGWDLNAITGKGNSTDGKAIRWEATTPLQPGQTIDGFQFSIAEPPSVIFADTPFYSDTLIDTSTVYQGGPFQGGSDKFVPAATVPGPASGITLLGSLIGMGLKRRRRNAKL